MGRCPTVTTSRQLAAVMFTDIVGYTALSESDEAGALRLVREQEEIVRSLLPGHHGREVKSTGDGLLVEFDSAREATQCAVEIQQRLRVREDQQGVTPLKVRVGIHLGDVERRGADIFGDAVNIASRVESLADPGGVCISEHVFAQVRNKVPYQLEPLGPKSLKGIREPVTIYRVVLPWGTPTPESPSPGLTRLAVLPFANISAEPNDEYFADGLTEELITVLSGLEELQVIARTSVTQYKSTTKSIAQIGSELGVSTVLEGSVRRAGSQLRVTVQLIDVATQGHTWASTFDRQLNDVFAVQAEIAQQVARSLRVKVRPAQEARLRARTNIRPDSYVAYLRGRAMLHVVSGAGLKGVDDLIEEASRLDPENAAAYAALSESTTDIGIEWASARIAETLLTEARKHFEEAIRLDPENAAAYTGLSDAIYIDAFEMSHRWSSQPTPRVDDRKATAECQSLVEKALRIDPGLAEGHASLGRLLLHDSGYASAEEELKLALTLNPSYSAARTWYANLLFQDGRTEEALDQVTAAEELDPSSYAARVNLALNLVGLVSRGPLLDGYRAVYYAVTGRTDKAEESLRRLTALDDGVRGRAQLMAVAYAYLGDLDRCFPSLRLALSRRETHLAWWKAAPRLGSLREDPRFGSLAEP